MYAIIYLSDVFIIYDVLGQDKLVVKHKPLPSAGTGLKISVCFLGAGSF